MRRLLAHGAPVDEDRYLASTPLQAAASVGSMECLDLLLERGADVNRGDVDGERPLHTACWSAQPAIVEQLLQHGADPNCAAETLLQRTPLFDAATSDCAECAQFLIDAGADVDQLDDQGRSALHEAAAHGAVRCARVLLEAGADPTLRSDHFSTAVSWTGLMPHVNLRRSRGATPRELAERHLHEPKLRPRPVIDEDAAKGRWSTEANYLATVELLREWEGKSSTA